MEAFPPRLRQLTIESAALALWTLGLVLIVARDGNPGWRVVRAVLVVAVACAAFVAGSGRAGGVAGLVLAVVGIDVGIVFGLRFAIDEGPVATCVAGLAVLAAALVLAIAGGRQLLAGRGRWRFAAGPLIGLVVLGLVWNTVPAVLATNLPPLERGSETPAAFGLAAVDVRFPAADGTELAGWYVPSRTGAAVVLRHGAGSTATANLAQAAVLAGHGYGVLLTDARGHGESEGRAMDFGWYGDDDIRGAVTFLVAQPDVDPARIGVVGFSMGGEEALGALAADDRIRTVVAEGVTGRTDADQTWFSEVYGWRGSVQRGLEWVEFTLTDALTDASKPTALAAAVAAAAPRRILLVTGGDVADEGHAAAHIQGAAPDRVVVHEVPGAGHTEGFATDPGAWEALVVAWLDAELATP